MLHDTQQAFLITGDATGNMHLQNLQGLAALANAANSPGKISIRKENGSYLVGVEM